MVFIPKYRRKVLYGVAGQTALSGSQIKPPALPEVYDYGFLQLTTELRKKKTGRSAALVRRRLSSLESGISRYESNFSGGSYLVVN